MKYSYLLLNTFIFSYFVVSFISCSNTSDEEEGIVYKDTNYESLFEPIALAFDSTVVYLDDYIKPIDSVTTVFFEGNSLPIEDRKVLLTQQPQKAMSYLTINTNNSEYILPLIRSSKKEVDFSYQADSEDDVVQIKGEMNGWNVNATELHQNGTLHTTSFVLEPGNYEYKMVVNGKEILDGNNVHTIKNNVGGINNVLSVSGNTIKRSAAEIQIDENHLSFKEQGENLYSELILWNNHLMSGGDLATNLPEAAKSLKRSHIRVYRYGNDEIQEAALIPLEYGAVIHSTDELTRHDLQTGILYNVFVDRFYNGDKNNDRPNPEKDIHPRANYHGGDVSGVIQKLEDGYFSDLGINTIWISPIVKNPLGAYGQYPEPKTRFSAYHGYWPISFTQVDSRLTTEAEVHDLIDEAHDQGYNVLLDFIANHVHEEHPFYKAHPEVATELYLPDGSLNTERWDDHRLTTWFDVFMPSLDLTRPEVYQMLSDSAVYWIEKYDFDGFRHDATKHVPNVFWRALTQKLKTHQQAQQQPPLYQIGETYGTADLISSYLGNGLLDAQFDFNVYDAIVAALLQVKSAVDLSAEIKNSLTFYGQHHKMGNITGNQDRARFISYASGDLSLGEDTKYAGWNRTIEKRTAMGYKKAAMLNTLVAMMPGLPVIFYGDEIGMYGGNDPDNRKMMRFKEDWNEDEQKLFNLTAEALKHRKKSMALNYGVTKVYQSSSGNTLIMENAYLNEKYIMYFNMSDEQYNLSSSVLQSYPHVIIGNQDKSTVEPWEYVVRRN